MSRTDQDIQDELLVLQCQDGDSDALKALITRWQPRFVRLAWRLTSQREAVSDIVQDAWMAIVRGIHLLDDPTRFRSWSYRIVSNKCTDWIRRRITQRNANDELRNELAASSGGSPRPVDTSDEIALLRDALAKLPDQQRAILSLHYLDGMNVTQIARVLSVPVGTVKSRLYHARNHLKQAMERMER